MLTLRMYCWGVLGSRSLTSASYMRTCKRTCQPVCTVLRYRSVHLEDVLLGCAGLQVLDQCMRLPQLPPSQVVDHQVQRRLRQHAVQARQHLRSSGSTCIQTCCLGGRIHRHAFTPCLCLLVTGTCLLSSQQPYPATYIWPDPRLPSWCVPHLQRALAPLEHHQVVPDQVVLRVAAACGLSQRPQLILSCLAIQQPAAAGGAARAVAAALSSEILVRVPMSSLQCCSVALL